MFPNEAPLTFREEMRERLTSLETSARLTHEAVKGAVTSLVSRVDKLEQRADRMEKIWWKLSVVCLSLTALSTIAFPKFGETVGKIVKLLF